MDPESFKNLSNLMIMKNALSDSHQPQPHADFKYIVFASIVLCFFMVLYLMSRQNKCECNHFNHPLNSQETFYNDRYNYQSFRPRDNIHESFSGYNMKFLN